MSKSQHPPGTFAFVPSTLAVDPDLGRPGLRVGCLLAAHADKNRRCWLSSETMARKLRSARSTVQEGLAQLVARGHAVKRERPGQTSVYQLIFRHPDELSPADDRVERSGPPVGMFAPDGQEVTGFPEEGDWVGRSEVTASDGRNQYNYERRDRDDEERERARRRETSSSRGPSGDSLDGRVLMDAEEACQVFDEMAERNGWPRAQRLTRKEQRLMVARLEDCGGLGGWRGAMAEAERSTYLGRTRPDLKFFLDEDHFAQLMRGRYAPELDPRSGLRSALEALATYGREDEQEEAATVAVATPWEEVAVQQSPPPARSPFPSDRAQPPPPPHPPQPRPDRLAAELAVVKVVSRVTTEQMDAEMQKWRGQLAAAGFGEAETTACLTEAALRVPKTPYAFIGMGERVARQVQRALESQTSP